MTRAVPPRQTALVTNAAGFAGPPAVDALLGAGFAVLAQDRGFADPAVAEAFRIGRSAVETLDAAAPEEIAASAFARFGTLSAIVSNDHWPAPAEPPETLPLGTLRDNLAHLVEQPFRLIRAALPGLRAQGGANVVMITSNRTRLPLRGGAAPDAARAAANALVRSLAVDCAPDGITVNAVAPNFLYSEQYYPAALFRDTERGRAHVRDSVPAGRLAEPEEIGEVILFLATARTRFLTGAIIDFSGGWPAGAARPED